MPKISQILLVAVLILATLLRFYNLSNNPPGLTWDEAALGYNSYSLMQTGRDEYGNFLPINLKSFGDFKPAFYAYLDIPFIALLGLNEIVVRLPSAIFGVLGVLGIYLLALKLFKNKYIALLSAFFLAISPWHIQFSRPAFEANVALTLNIFAVYFFIKGLENKKIFLISALLFGFSLLTYQASKMFVPLLIAALTIVYWHRGKISKFEVYSLVIICIFILVTIYAFFSGQTTRLTTQNIFAYTRSIDETRLISSEDGLDQKGLEFRVLHGQWWEYIREVTERYLIYFSPKMLFVQGDYSERHRVPDLGVLYASSLFLIPVGLVYLIKFGGRGSNLILLWLVLSPLPAVFSRDLISTLRALNMVAPIAILEALGTWWLIETSSRIKKNFGYLVAVIIFFVISVNFVIYLDRYFIHAPIEYSKFWLFGYKGVFNELKDTDLSKYNKVVVSDTYGQPYVYYLFYRKYSPANFQKQAILEQSSAEVGTVRKIDNIEFRHIFWPADRGEQNSLFIGTLEELPDQDILGFKLIKDINFLNGEKAFRIVETR